MSSSRPGLPAYLFYLCGCQDIAADVLQLTQKYNMASLVTVVGDKIHQAVDSNLRNQPPSSMVWQWLVITERLGITSARALCLNYIKNHGQQMAHTIAPTSAAGATHQALAELQPATMVELLHFSLSHCYLAYASSVGQQNKRADDNTVYWEQFTGRSQAADKPSPSPSHSRRPSGLVSEDSAGEAFWVTAERSVGPTNMLWYFRTRAFIQDTLIRRSSMHTSVCLCAFCSFICCRVLCDLPSC